MRQINAEGLVIIKEREGLELSAYPDPGSDLGKTLDAKHLRMRDYKKIPNWQQLKADPWTIGYGTTGPQVKEGLTIDLLAAEMLLKWKCEQFEISVEKLVKVPLNDNQFSALVCLTYNIGPGNLSTSTLLKKLNTGDYQGASNHFIDWIYSNGAVFPGLITRRKKEQALFLTPVKAS